MSDEYRPPNSAWINQDPVWYICSTRDGVRVRFPKASHLSQVSICPPGTNTWIPRGDFWKDEMTWIIKQDPYRQLLFNRPEDRKADRQPAWSVSWHVLSALEDNGLSRVFVYESPGSFVWATTPHLIRTDGAFRRFSGYVGEEKTKWPDFRLILPINRWERRTKEVG